jgi:hypothetical protein
MVRICRGFLEFDEHFRGPLLADFGLSMKDRNRPEADVRTSLDLDVVLAI